MTLADFEVQQKILRSKTSPEEYAIYKAALEWALTDPIVIESKDDFKSAPRWRERLEPYQHQVKNLITFCRWGPRSLGQTISTFDSRERERSSLMIRPALMVLPSRRHRREGSSAGEMVICCL